MRHLLLLAFCLLSGPIVQAASDNPPPPPPGQGQAGPGHLPPREAMQACAGKKEGDSVSFNSPRGDKVMAHCHLLAIPDRPPSAQP